jgi:hypothetical protein
MPRARVLTCSLALSALAIGCNQPLPSAPQPVAAPPAPEPAAAAPAPVARGCGLPKGPGPGVNCPRTSPSYLADVESAIATLQSQKPHLFDFTQSTGGRRFRVLDANAYYLGVIDILELRGFCTLNDDTGTGHRELGVKRDTNAFSDQYNILVSNGFVRDGEGSYRATCYPAWF